MMPKFKATEFVVQIKALSSKNKIDGKEYSIKLEPCYLTSEQFKELDKLTGTECNAICKIEKDTNNA